MHLQTILLAASVAISTSSQSFVAANLARDLLAFDDIPEESPNQQIVSSKPYAASNPKNYDSGSETDVYQSSVDDTFQKPVDSTASKPVTPSVDPIDKATKPVTPSVDSIDKATKPVIQPVATIPPTPSKGYPTTEDDTQSNSQSGSTDESIDWSEDSSLDFGSLDWTDISQSDAGSYDWSDSGSWDDVVGDSESFDNDFNYDDWLSSMSGSTDDTVGLPDDIDSGSGSLDWNFDPSVDSDDLLNDGSTDWDSLFDNSGSFDWDSEFDNSGSFDWDIDFSHSSADEVGDLLPDSTLSESGSDASTEESSQSLAGSLSVPAVGTAPTNVTNSSSSGSDVSQCPTGWWGHMKSWWRNTFGEGDDCDQDQQKRRLREVSE